MANISSKRAPKKTVLVFGVPLLQGAAQPCCAEFYTFRIEHTVSNHDCMPTSGCGLIGSAANLAVQILSQKV